MLGGFVAHSSYGYRKDADSTIHVACAREHDCGVTDRSVAGSSRSKDVLMFRHLAAISLTVLLASEATPALAQRIPPGTYQQSCRNIHVRGQQLIANCSAPNGQRIRSSIPLGCRGDIGNVNGYLRCNRNGRHRR